MYQKVAALRRALSSAGAPESLTTKARGYILRVDPECVDLHCYRGLVQRARDALRLTDERRAVEHFRAAERLWNGDALAGLEGTWAESTRAVLAGEYLTAARQRIAAELALGQDGELVGAIRELIHRYPLDSELIGYLMLALHRSGHQDEAIRCYEEAKERFDAEHGMSPPRQLSELYYAIGQNDPRLLWSGPPGSRETAVGTVEPASEVLATEVPTTAEPDREPAAAETGIGEPAAGAQPPTEEKPAAVLAEPPAPEPPPSELRSAEPPPTPGPQSPEPSPLEPQAPEPPKPEPPTPEPPTPEPRLPGLRPPYSRRSLLVAAGVTAGLAVGLAVPRGRSDRSRQATPPVRASATNPATPAPQWAGQATHVAMAVLGGHVAAMINNVNNSIYGASRHPGIPWKSRLYASVNILGSPTCLTHATMLDIFVRSRENAVLWASIDFSNLRTRSASFVAITPPRSADSEIRAVEYQTVPWLFLRSGDHIATCTYADPGWGNLRTVGTVRGVTGSVGAARFRDRLYAFARTTGGAVLWSAGGVDGWDPFVPVPVANVAGEPVPVSHDDRLWLFVRDGGGAVLGGSFDKEWSRFEPVMPDVHAIDGPHVTVFGDRLALAAIDQAPGLIVNYGDHGTWTRPIRVGGQHAAGAPAIAAYGDLLLLLAVDAASGKTWGGEFAGDRWVWGSQII